MQLQELKDKTHLFTDTLNEISKYIFTSKYARYNAELGRRETWEEAVSRVEDMHLRKFAHIDQKYLEEIRWAFDLVRDKRSLPSMRSMQFGGKAIEAHEARMFNCSVMHVDSLRSFSEAFYLLLCGSGVGFGLSKRFLSRLPDLVSAEDKTGIVMTYVVEDSIEGWADSIEVLLDGYFKATPYSGRKIVFDYSRIRPAGAELKTSGGKAPGYEGLKAAHSKVKELLDTLIEVKGQNRLYTIDAYDILMHVADAVLSGGVRRSACAVIFDKDDYRMINAKTGNWFEENPQRARSNNSVLLVRDEITYEEFESIALRTKEWGEPGFVFSDHHDVLFNPCFEIGFLPVTDDGRTGVQFCNLTTVNGGKVTTKDELFDAVRAAAIIGTLQASYTNFKYLSNTAKELTENEALLGVSITGMLENPDVLLDPVVLQTASAIAVETNAHFAKVIGINPAARVTCVKPEGTSSLALGSMYSGIHPAHSRVMWRRVQANKLDNVYRHFKDHNPHLCEESVWSANDTDDVITFPIMLPENGIVKSELGAIEHLDIIKNVQKNWVLPGTSPTNSKQAAHNVSCTTIVGENEWDSVFRYIYENNKYFTAVSLLSKTGDKEYKQAPNESVHTEEELDKFYSEMYNFIGVDYSWLNESEDNTKLIDAAACAGPQGCELK